MTLLRIAVGPHRFTARLEENAAPRTCAAFRALLPSRNTLLHARWSGEACWVPLGDFQLGAGGLENPTGLPSPGDLLFHPADHSETEILFPYGTTRFAAQAGPLTGSHFLTIVDGRDQLADMGRLVLWKGAQEISFETI